MLGHYGIAKVQFFTRHIDHSIIQQWCQSTEIITPVTRAQNALLVNI